MGVELGTARRDWAGVAAGWAVQGARTVLVGALATSLGCGGAEDATVVDVVAEAAPDGAAPSTVVFGLTLDSVADLPAIVDALKSLPRKPWVRIVFDYPLPPSDYIAAVQAIAPWAEIIGQPSDSSMTANLSVAAYRDRFASYVASLPEIAVWETCNECNSETAGANTAAQADAATDVVKAAGKQALFTPYWNTPSCADANGPYVAWTRDHISTKVKTLSDYVMPSIYGVDCDGPEPSYPELDDMVATFAEMFPNAQVGIGEFGKRGDAAVLQYYLNYRNANRRYIFGGLYWFGAQDLVPKSKPLWQVFSAHMR